VAKGIEVTIDGNPAALINLSVVGAQVVSPTILKPNQRSAHDHAGFARGRSA
jgi:hypothetical protein